MKHEKGTLPDSAIYRNGHRDPVIDKSELLDKFGDLPRELQDKAFQILQTGESEHESYFRSILAALDEQLQFERLVTKISSQCINLENKQLNEAISIALGEVSQFMGSDLSTFIELDHKTGLIQHTHQWTAPGVTFGINFIDINIYNSAPWVARELTKLEPIVISCLDDFPKDATEERALAEGAGINSVIWVPIAIGGTFVACLALNSLRREMTWSNGLIRRLRLLGEVFANSLVRSREDRELKNAFQKIRQLKKQLEHENVQLRSELDSILGNPEIIGSTPVMQRLSQQLEQVAKTDTTVLLLGETGTGKELIARSLHRRSRRWKQPLILVNCAALPAPLIESELFGHEKGAFTGATSRNIGRFELADGGTLLLDEIGDLPQELQAKLLRVLQEGEFERVGSAKTLKVDVRVITATNRDLEKMVDEGAFRADLYYRLSVFPITIPPLRLRRDDIPLLVWYFVEKLQSRFGKRFKTISRRDMEALTGYDWPGNVRELSNVVERALILSAQPRLGFGDVMNHQSRASAQSDTVRTASGARLEDMEREHILRVLENCGWRVRGESGAAERLGLKRSTLVSRMKKLGIERPGK